jgi:hypothetical protein
VESLTICFINQLISARKKQKMEMELSNSCYGAAKYRMEIGKVRDFFADTVL